MTVITTAVTTLEERLLDAAIRLHLESGQAPAPERWREFRRAAEALWQGDPKRSDDANGNS